MYSHEIIESTKNFNYITSVTLEYCSEMVKSIKWETLENLLYLDISNMRLSSSSMFNFLSNVNKKLRHLSIRNIHLHSYNPSYEGDVKESFHLMQTI